MRQWFRLDSSYITDGRLARAGWQAVLLWPVVLARLKERGGVCAPEDVDPRLLARLLGAPIALVTSGIDGLRAQGLLVPGRVRMPGGPGGVREVAGLVTPSWREHNPDGGSLAPDPVPDRSPRNAHERGREQAAAPASALPIVPAGTLANAVQDRTGQDETGQDTPPPPSRGSAGPPGVCDPGSSRSEMTIAMERVWEAYRRHHPQAGAGTRAGDGGPARAARKLLRRACGDHDAGALVVLMDYVHTSGEGGPRFLRGENADSRKYLGLDNLLRAEKLPARVEAALAWEARGRLDEGAPSNGGGAAGDKTARLRAMAARVAAEQRRARPAEEG